MVPALHLPGAVPTKRENSSWLLKFAGFAAFCATVCISACNPPFGPQPNAINPTTGNPATPLAGIATPTANPTQTATPAAGFQSWVLLDVTYGGPVTSNPGPSPSPTLQPSAPGNLCDLPRHVIIYRNGSYVAGPCLAQSTQTVPGNLDPNSTLQLIELVDPVISGDLSAPPDCSPDTQLGAMVASILLADESVTQVISYTSAQNGTCYRGGTTAAQALGYQLIADINQIYAQAFGAPPAPQP